MLKYSWGKRGKGPDVIQSSDVKLASNESSNLNGRMLGRKTTGLGNSILMFDDGVELFDITGSPR